MANKLINVIYKVDDSALTAAKAKVQDVATATKQSESAMLAYSQSVTKSGMVISQTLEGQKLQLAQLKAQIDLTKQSDTERLNRLKADYDQVKAKIDQFNSSLKQTEAQGSVNIGTFQKLGAAIAAAVSVAAVKQIIAYNLEMTNLAGRVQGVEAAFKRAFLTAPQLLETLRKSTHGTVTDFELMQRTLQATNLGVSAEHLGVLFEFAAARAQQTGESVDYLVDSIVRGIGRKSILVLDNLGISATRLREQFNGASIASKSVAEVTAGVAKIAKTELEKMGGYTENSATKTDQLKASVETLKQEVAKRIESSGFIAFLDDVVKKTTDAVKGTDELRKEFEELAASKMFESFKNGQKTGPNQVDFRPIPESKLPADKLPQKEDINKEIILRANQAKAIEQVLEANKNSATYSHQRYQEQVTELNTLNGYIDLLRKYRDSLKNTATEDKGYIESLKEKIKELNEAIEKAPFDQIGSLQARLDSAQKSLKTAQLLRPVWPSMDNLKMTASEEAQILADAQQTVNDDAEKSYEEGLRILKDADQERLNQIKIDRDRENDLQKEKDKADLEREKAHQQYKQQLQQAFENFALNSSARILQNLFINRQLDQQDLSQYYQDQIDSAGNNAQARKAIEKKVAAEKAANDAAFRQQQIELDKENAIKNIEIQTAVGIAKTFAEYGFPMGVPFAALLAAQAAIEIMTVKSVQSRSLNTRAFAKGEVGIDGPGTTTSDSIPAWLSKGESVINAQATAESRNLLEAINDRKINDNILRTIAGDGGRQATVFDDSGIIKAIQESKVDLAVQGYSLMRSERQGSNFKRYIRSKVQGY